MQFLRGFGIIKADAAVSSRANDLVSLSLFKVFLRSLRHRRTGGGRGGGYGYGHG